MVAITFPVSTSPGLRASEEAGRLINCYAEPVGEGGRSVAVRHRAPGMKTWGTTSRTGYRGGFISENILYGAYSGQMEKWAAAGASTNVAALNGTKKGFFAQNNAATPNRVFVDPDGNIATFTATTVTNSWPDADLPAVNSVTSINGYLVFTTGAGAAWATGLNTTAVDPLSFGTASAKPDGLTRGIAWGGRLYLMGPQTTEIWNDQGLSPFPFGRADVMPIGIAGPYCVTGFEDGFAKGLFMVAGDNAVYSIVGNAYSKISPPDLDGHIELVSDKTTIEMCSYLSRGHAFIQISSATWTWVYNLNNGKWHERISYLDDRSRITQTVYAFGKWLCGDTDTGNLPEITRTSALEVTSPLICEVQSAPVQKFPQRMRVATAWFDFAVGVGEATGTDPIATDPTVEISWSDDGGQTFCTPRQRKLGRQSIGTARVRVNQCGRTGAQGRIWKIVMSDPVHFGLMSGEMAAELLAA
jgi:hypothetical protein